MKWPTRLLLLPIMAVFHGFLVVCFVVACAGSMWQWLINSKD